MLLLLSVRIVLLIAVLLLSALFGVVKAESKLTGKNVLVLYKNSDVLSKKIAEYYAQQRKVPRSQLVSVSISTTSDDISSDEFAQIHKQISPYLDKRIKVILLTWHTPYKVDCMGITAAFALGFDEKYCGRYYATKTKTSCNQTANSLYFNADSDKLWQDDDLRLSMMLSAGSFEQAKQLIDRGVMADNSKPVGHGYLLKTKDMARSTRWTNFKQIAEIWPEKKGIQLHYIDGKYSSQKTLIKNKRNIMFYLTGYTLVEGIETNSYLPGAIADHLTSYGGAGGVDGVVGQMSIHRWLDAGVTGSYGTVIEPCSYTQKFPNARILIPSYLYGDSLIEAYWKSVQQPGEGIFIGEPLACPWCDKNR